MSNMQYNPDLYGYPEWVFDLYLLWFEIRHINEIKDAAAELRSGFGLCIDSFTLKIRDKERWEKRHQGYHHLQKALDLLNQKLARVKGSTAHATVETALEKLVDLLGVNPNEIQATPKKELVEAVAANQMQLF